MKTLLKLITMVLVLGLNTAFAQEKAKTTETATIKSSMVCDMCKRTLTESLAFEKGVKKVQINVEKQEIKVTFNPTKTDLMAIKTAITKTGYDADELEAEPKAYSKLEDCCKKHNPIHK